MHASECAAEVTLLEVLASVLWIGLAILVGHWCARWGWSAGIVGGLACAGVTLWLMNPSGRR
ncbi:MAG: hypothetical protein H6718_13730 [Polyangiaceae bacterium]|nr:hypothetical protein [Polyangiaceae bacterium]